MVIGKSLGRCESHHECKIKYGNSVCINMNSKGIGHCTGSIMSKLTSLGGKRKTNKKGQKMTKKNKKRRKNKTNKKRRR
jgi:hypothetical protein